MTSMNDETIYTMEERGEAVAESGHGTSRRLHARGVPVRKRKKTSRCWISFKELPVTEDQIERAECIKCGAVYKCDSITGTGSLLRHHDTCYSSSNVVSPQSSTRSSKFQYEKFSELLIEAIVQHDLPFSFVEYEGIRAVFQYISPSLKLPCRNTVKAHVLKLFDSEKLKLRNLLSSVKGRICLTSDLWSSQATDGYLTLTAHFIDSEWKLHKRILSFCHMPPPHNGIALAEKINSLICEWEIEKRLFSITLDNASANDSFVEKLRTQLNFRGLLLLNGKFFHVRCCAHILSEDYIFQLPEEIGDLTHLRYLDLSYCINLSSLPDGVCNLYNLQTLRLDDCTSLEELPDNMGKLINLKHLHVDLQPNRGLKYLPKGIRRIRNLRTLDGSTSVYCSEDPKALTLGDLRMMNQLRRLDIVISRVGENAASEAEKAELNQKLHLSYLKLVLDDGRDNDVNAGVMNALRVATT